MFVTHEILADASWRSFERLISRLLVHKGFTGVRIVGATGDKGADIIAIGPNGKRWLFQAKFWNKPVPEDELKRMIEAGRTYSAPLMVMVSKYGADDRGVKFQIQAKSQGHTLSIWDSDSLVKQASSLPIEVVPRPAQGDYQEVAIQRVTEMLLDKTPSRGLLVMATGLGKTFTAAESIRRARLKRKMRVLILAHTNSLVLQLEKAFWLFLGPLEPTFVWTQYEKPTEYALENANFIFASRDSVFAHLRTGGHLPSFDLVLIDECHHAHSKSAVYSEIIKELGAGLSSSRLLLGLTATPFLADPEARLESVFGDVPLITIDMIYGLKHGFLSQIDYRLFTSNINWDSLGLLKGQPLSPKSINRIFFIKEWDEAVVSELQNTWPTVKNPKAIIFCGTIEHALKLTAMLNVRQFCHAEAIYSGSCNGRTMTSFEKNLLLSDFEAGKTNVVCTVDVFNEGIDVPDVNIIAFNRVTHSRRIFIQQMGRGLRVSREKEKAIILDFAQDIRRYAAGLQMKDGLSNPSQGITIALGHKVSFRNAQGEDSKAESFLRAWLDDVERIEAMGDEETGVLKFPPALVD